MNRRHMLRQAALLIGYVLGIVGVTRRQARAELADVESWPNDLIRTGWASRSVAPADETALVEVMRASVADARAFNGFCAPLEWTIDWARYVIGEHPDSVVVSWKDQVVAFMDIPPKRPTSPSAEVERNQEAFWCAAAGVRSDLISPDLALRVFQQMLHHGFRRARNLGYNYVRCAAPWEKHPSLPRPFAEYAGLTVTPFLSDEGEQRYRIEWCLQDAIAELEAEGAATGLL